MALARITELGRGKTGILSYERPRSVRRHGESGRGDLSGRHLVGVLLALAAIAWIFTAGCRGVLPPVQAPLFLVPLEIDGRAVGNAIIDTGGDYEVLLRDVFHLTVVGEIEVLVFGGRESVRLTEGFRFAAGGFQAESSGAIVGISSCNCNGIGVQFFRDTGAVAALDFSAATATFASITPPGGIHIAYDPPPDFLDGFHSSFIDVRVEAGGEAKTLRALVDTGSVETLLKRGPFDVAAGPPGGRSRITIRREELGTVSVSAAVFENDALPDLIIGTDVMRAWGDQWFFRYTGVGGFMTVFPVVPPVPAADQASPEDAVSAKARIRSAPEILAQ